MDVEARNEHVGFCILWVDFIVSSTTCSSSCCSHRLQYCDRGSMEKACEQNRFMNKLDGKPDMVNIPPSFCAAS